MFLIPYRTKNPSERVPYVTYFLIAINVLVYLCTTDYFLFVQKSAIEALAFTSNNADPVRMLTAMFLHADPLHLLGNMLFLWIFGPAVEGRLGPIKYTILYFLAGYAGDLLQMVTIGEVLPHLWNFGASAAIMGVAGAYLFLFPFATICVVWGYGFIGYRIGVADWAAQWVILYFLGFDLANGLIYQGLDGVGHFAHLGGAAAGFLLALACRGRRDTEEMSAAQAMRSDARGDYNVLAVYELEALVERSPGDITLLMTFCRKAALRSEVNGPQRAMAVIRQHADALLANCDAEQLAELILTIPSAGGPPPTALLMRLGSKLESNCSYDLAIHCYRRVFNDDRTSRDAESALIRWARLTEQADPDKRNAAALYLELLQAYPRGAQSMYAESALRRMGFEVPRPAPPGAPPAAPPAVKPDWDAPPAEAGTATTTLAPIVAAAPAATRAETTVEPGYNVGDTRGMVLRPLGAIAAPNDASAS